MSLPIIVIGDPWDESTWTDPETGRPYDRHAYEGDDSPALLIVPPAVIDDDSEAFGALLDALAAVAATESSVTEFRAAVERGEYTTDPPEEEES